MNMYVLITMVAMMLACGSRPEIGSPGPRAAPVAGAEDRPGEAERATRPRPEIGEWGFDLAGMDRSVRPGASFWRYANGGWLASTTIPAERSSYSMFTVLQDRSDERTRRIIESASGAPGTDGQRIGDYYRTFMDEAAIEAKDLAPIQGALDQVALIRDQRGLVRELAARARRFGVSPVIVFVQADERAPEAHLATLYQSGLGLRDRDMYDAGATQFAKVRDAYRKYIATMFTLIGHKDAEQRAARVYALEAKLAQAHWTQVESRDPQKTYNKLTIAQLRKLAPELDWSAWLAVMGLDAQPAIGVTQPSAIAAIARLVKHEPLAVWKDYLALHLVTEAAPYLSSRFVDAHFEMFYKAMWGTPQIKPRWKRGVDDVISAMGQAVGKIYVAQYFTPETRARAEALVANVRQAMKRRIEALAWMSPATKTAALEKLAAIEVDIGQPRRWRDDSSLTIVAGDAVGNMQRASEQEYRRLIAKLGQPVGPEDWWMTPMSVDAYASFRGIVLPAGIFQPPFFDANADEAINYGGIGAFIGHEFSHLFDDRGAQYDARGALKNWWTAEDAERFKAATARLVAQYAAYCPVAAADGKPAQCVNGALTLSENVSDLAGVTVAYDAYQLALGGRPAPVLDGLSGAQRFFLGWAQIWRSQHREQELANRLATDPHSPYDLRVATVRNIDAWYDAFKPSPTDALYLAPDQRVRIW